MVAKCIAISILAGLLAAMTPVLIVWLWTISKVFVSTVLLFALIVGFLALVLRVLDKEIEVKRLKEQLEEKEIDEE